MKKKLRDTRFKPGISRNEITKWKPGQFEEEFNEALINGGGSDQAAKLLWEVAAARNPGPFKNSAPPATCAELPIFRYIFESAKQVHAQVVCHGGNSGHAQGELFQLGSLLHGTHVPV